jgi:hypothetical protein
MRIAYGALGGLALMCAAIACGDASDGTSSNLGGGTGGGVSGSGGFPGGSGGVGGQDLDAASVDANDAANVDSSNTGGGGACKSSCLGNECGHTVPDNCGSSLDCGDCGDGTDSCIVLAPLHQGAVKKAIEDTKVAHPEYFDPTNTNGDGWYVMDLGGFTSNLVTLLVETGRVALVDPNDENEIRVRAASETTAENYHVHTSAGYSAYKYTSTCSPAGF